MSLRWGGVERSGKHLSQAFPAFLIRTPVHFLILIRSLDLWLCTLMLHFWRLLNSLFGLFHVDGNVKLLVGLEACALSRRQTMEWILCRLMGGPTFSSVCHGPQSPTWSSFRETASFSTNIMEDHLGTSPPSLSSPTSHGGGADRFVVFFWQFGVNDAC